MCVLYPVKLTGFLTRVLGLGGGARNAVSSRNFEWGLGAKFLTSFNIRNQSTPIAIRSCSPS